MGAVKRVGLIGCGGIGRAVIEVLGREGAANGISLGAVLVRPDRFVAWRSLDAAADPAASLATAFSQLLGRMIEPVRS